MGATEAAVGEVWWSKPDVEPCVEVDLLDEVVHWATDDFWSYAGLAAVAWIRAVAASRGMALYELCRRLRAQAPRPGS